MTDDDFAAGLEIAAVPKLLNIAVDKGAPVLSIYIAGPMTGIDESNYPAFHAAAKSLRSQGWRVENPAELFDGDATKPRAEYMREDFKSLLRVDAICLLPGWENSRGARLECEIACELGLQVSVYERGALRPLMVGTA